MACTATPGVPDFERTVSTFLDLASIPWEYARAIHGWQEEWARFCAHFCMGSAFPPHAHEARWQLEIPDPIAAEAEQDLFA
ncbi:hypothetical protein FHS61_002822 [Altererythrobacter atlanticus]|uniref:Uncharacterized protein n=1 Tax=Croceibacterium atlanticum TaxID=1267766 RepID=A0A0F7KX24_9SPHN|nr:hypothetical protein [Croceibacterium atlanticum]AKH43772.1 hypothetical protein WYH_02742 [Croceibacterium atlanticum]MBB5733779.1 hypothetical protein [Croceibacterium atlanticum]